MARVRTAAVLAIALLLAGAAAMRAQAPVPRIGVAELKTLMDAGKVTVLDVRSAAAYREGHVPGALSVPLDVVGQKAPELKQAGRILVAYCT